MPRRATLLLSGSLIFQIACGASDRAPVVAPTSPPNVAPLPTTGKIVVIAQEHGNGIDADGFSTTIDQTQTRTLSYDTAARYDSVMPGEHTIRLSGVAQHCRAENESQAITTKAGAIDTIRMELTCIGGLAYHQLVSSNEFDIAYLTPDGRTIQLATGPERKFAKAWSPDGSQLLYVKDEGTAWQLYTVRVDGTDTRRLMGSAWALGPAFWSPDGSRIEFNEDDPSGNASRIVMTDPNGANRRELMSTSAYDFDADWAPDGTRLYFGCNRYNRWVDLCTAAVDGSGLRAIRYALIDSIEARRPKCTAYVCISIANPAHFRVSPDGRSILFELFPYGGVQSVWVGALDGSRAVNLSGPQVSFGGSWSPTGDRLLIALWDGTTRFALATVKSDGSDFRQITSYDDHDETASFSPDGALIAFDGYRSGMQQLWVMNADGGGGRQIIFGSSASFYPVWNPKVRPTGALTGGQPSRASSLQPRRPVLDRSVIDAGNQVGSSACRAIRIGTAYRITCPSSP